VFGAPLPQTACPLRIHPMDRRDFIKTTSAAALVSSRGNAATREPAARQPDLIQRENARPGADFQLTRVMLDSTKGFRAANVEGYCSRQSVKAGENIDFFVSTSPVARFHLEIFRMGYYGGAGSRLMTVLGPFEGRMQPDPPIGGKRLRECAWEATTSFTIPDDWPSGVYQGRLTTLPDAADQPYWQSYVIFIVKDDRPADVLFQCSDNTWQAYNRWPNGWSLYTDPRAAHAPDVSVSFDRPYGKYCQIYDSALSVGSGEFLMWEFPLCYWLEQHGYDVTYCSNSDVLAAGGITRCKAMLSVGHDEYWDIRQYNSVKKAIDEGVNVLFLSANDCYMVTPFTPNDRGDPLRRLTRQTCYGEFREEEKQAYSKVLGPFENPGPDERDIIGARTAVPFTASSAGNTTASPTLIAKAWKSLPKATSGPAASSLESMPPPFIPGPRAISSSTPPPSGGARASAILPATSSPGATGAAPMDRTSACSASRQTS
jgi:hypothetical protein